MFTFSNSYRSLPGDFYSDQNPEPVSNPEICLFNRKLAEELNLDIPDDKEIVRVLSGNSIPEGTIPISQAYAGHQFGHFTNLGDGRAVLLGEHRSNNSLVDIQFKGSGRTPYSRRGDGRASLGPMLREYIISEAMGNLAIPTTRSLAVVKTGEPVYRERVEPGAILTRVASSHIRVGTFQYAAAMDKPGLIKALLEYSVNRHYPELEGASDMALQFLQAVGKRQAALVSQWMRVGFIHGVMNTDNTSISGETIDYGPCAFMDEYHGNTVFSSIDTAGRYAYGNQLPIIHWNMARLAETLLTLLHHDEKKALEIAQDFLKDMGQRLENEYLKAMAGKIGITEPREGDAEIISSLLKWMEDNKLDYTNTFRDLSQDELPRREVYNNEEFTRWHDSWSDRLTGQESGDSTTVMKAHNPAVIPRNHLVEKALHDAVHNDDYGRLHSLLNALREPYADNPQLLEYQKPPQDSERVIQTFCGT